MANCRRGTMILAGTTPLAADGIKMFIEPRREGIYCPRRNDNALNLGRAESGRAGLVKSNTAAVFGCSNTLKDKEPLRKPYDFLKPNRQTFK
jgi:hypothetical protein